jgi:hypothetical protein
VHNRLAQRLFQLIRDIQTSGVSHPSLQEEEDELEAEAEAAYEVEMLEAAGEDADVYLDDQERERRKKARRLLRSRTYPSVAGGGLRPLAAPEVEFPVLLLGLLGLDGRCEEAVLLLRRQALRLVGQSEFADSSEFRNPSLSFVLPDVPCGFCLRSRGVDLFRDPFLLGIQSLEPARHPEDPPVPQRLPKNNPNSMELDSDSSGTEGTPDSFLPSQQHLAKGVHRDEEGRLSGWICLHCQHPLDTEGVERQLIATLHRRSLAYQVQDLQCEKCGLIKEPGLSLLCSNCSGPFKNSVSPEAFLQQVRMFKQLAKVHHFEALEEVADWMLSGGTASN